MSPRNPPLSFIRPLLPSLVEAPPVGEDWLHEIKHDGYRTIVVVEGGRARAFTRNGHDWTERFSRVAESAGPLPAARRSSTARPLCRMSAASPTSRR